MCGDCQNSLPMFTPQYRRTMSCKIVTRIILEMADKYDLNRMFKCAPKLQGSHANRMETMRAVLNATHMPTPSADCGFYQ